MPTIHSVSPGEMIAPANILAEVAQEDYFRAVVTPTSKKANITSDDYGSLARRLIGLSEEVFEESNVEVVKNRDLVIGAIAMEEPWVADEGQRYRPEDSLLLPSFADMFNSSHTMEVHIAPADRSEHDYSFVQMIWEKRMPRIIYFYAQGNREGDSIKQHLYERMFHVPGSAPNKLLNVGLGLAKTMELRRPYR